MYKIVLNDHNCVEGYEGESAFFFTEDTEDFEKRWIALGADAESVECFRRSKAGLCISDTWFDRTDDNIVNSYDDEEILAEKEYELTDLEFSLSNTTEGRIYFSVEKGSFRYCWIRLGEEYYRIASYHAEGVRCKYSFDESWTEPSFAGNPVLEHSTSENGTTISTICYLLSGVFYDKEKAARDIEVFDVKSRGEIENLFEDAVGNTIEPEEW